MIHVPGRWTTLYGKSPFVTTIWDNTFGSFKRKMVVDPSSQNQGLVKNGCISNSSCLSNTPIFHKIMIMGERVRVLVLGRWNIIIFVFELRIQWLTGRLFPPKTEWFWEQRVADPPGIGCFFLPCTYQYSRSSSCRGLGVVYIIQSLIFVLNYRWKWVFPEIGVSPKWMVYNRNPY